jgi:hypothetical protein
MFSVLAKGFDDVQLNVTRTVQEDPLRYCGAACLQMIMRSYGIEDTQTNIWNATRFLLAPESSGVWYTDPRAISKYLDSFEAPVMASMMALRKWRSSNTPTTAKGKFAAARSRQ